MIERSSEKRTRNSKQTANALGILFEERALRYLTRQGLIALNKNYRCPRGEIDLVMQDPETQMIVFVEVRARYRSDFGGAADLEAVTKLMQKITSEAGGADLKPGDVPDEKELMEMMKVLKESMGSGNGSADKGCPTQ